MILIWSSVAVIALVVIAWVQDRMAARVIFGAAALLFAGIGVTLQFFAG